MNISTAALQDPYFDVSEVQVIRDLDTLVSLNVEQLYYRPGSTEPVTDLITTYRLPHTTPGIFRGQVRDWPLLPKSFRDARKSTATSETVRRIVEWTNATDRFRRFCERAQVQVPSFPAGARDRMSIAQHFGIPTPLLDWSQNIFAAIFFALDEVFSDPEHDKTLRVFIYHVRDERLLRSLPDDAELSKVDYSAFLRPYHIDRRIERQRGVFTFHPPPSRNPERIAAQVYALEWDLIPRLLDLMKGLGYTRDYYFPDYSGIAQAVLSNTSL